MNEELKPHSCIINNNGRFIESSSEFAKSLGLRQSDMEFRYLLSYFRSEDAWTAFKTRLTEDGSFMLNTTFRRKNRRSFGVRLSCTKLTDTRFMVQLR
jgi:hypothetical protein